MIHLSFSQQVSLSKNKTHFRNQRKRKSGPPIYPLLLPFPFHPQIPLSNPASHLQTSNVGQSENEPQKHLRKQLCGFAAEGTGDFYFPFLFLVCRIGGCVLWFWHLLSPVDSSPSERIPRSVRGVPSLSFPPVSNPGSNASPSPLYLGPDHRTGIAMG
ncbi:hypothetical protein TNCV_1105421 [Trichonephila clavipes]|nr:hypothetical protein TNCV_1105421 [Trichonephila clavipes]